MLAALRILYLVALCAHCGIATSEPWHTESVRIEGPTIVAVLPRDFLASNEDGNDEAAAHLRFAVEDTLKCLQPKQPKVVFVHADVVTLHSGATRQRVAAHNLGQAVGAVLVEPKRRSRIVFAAEGPSTLLQILPQAAAQYWNSPGCRQ